MYAVVVFLLAELKTALATEQAQRQKLEETDRLKNELLGVAAHDLRSPAAVVKMHAELLRAALGPNPDENQRKSLEAITAKSALMLRLVGEVLDFSRIESGSLSSPRGSGTTLVSWRTRCHCSGGWAPRRGIP